MRCAPISKVWNRVQKRGAEVPEPCVRGGLPYIFSKTKPVKFVEQELFGDSDDDQGVTEEEAAFLRRCSAS